MGERVGPGEPGLGSVRAVKPGGTSLGCWLGWKCKRGCKGDDEVGWEVKARAARFSKARARLSEAKGQHTPRWKPLPYGDLLPL